LIIKQYYTEESWYISSLARANFHYHKTLDKVLADFAATKKRLLKVKKTPGESGMHKILHSNAVTIAMLDEQVAQK